MTQGELSRILHELDCPVNEGVSSLKNTMKFPRIDYWEIVWEDIVASGEEYAEKITWQISFYARKPRDRKLLELRDALRKLGFHPMISHEYNTEDAETVCEAGRSGKRIGCDRSRDKRICE